MSQVNIVIPAYGVDFFVGSMLLCISKSYVRRAWKGNGEGTSGEVLTCNIGDSS